MLDFFDTSLDGPVDPDHPPAQGHGRGRQLALLDLLHDSGIDVTAPPFASLTGYGAASLEGFIDDCLKDGERAWFASSIISWTSRMISANG